MPSSKLLRPAFALLCLCGCMTLPPADAQADPPKPAFEVISIHADPDATSMSMDVGPTAWDAKGAPLRLLLYSAFSIKEFQVQNVPRWVDSERYTIHAKVPGDLSKLPEAEGRRTFGLMVQNMLVDRFHLHYHWTTKEVSVLSLVLEKGEPKLTAAAAGDKYRLSVGRNVYDAHAITMADFAENLGGNLDQIVQDHTGLAGSYTFRLAYAPSADADVAASASEESKESRLFTALRDQLGLKLVAEKRPIPVLVVDDIERPTPN